MPRILKRIFTQDQQGRILGQQAERLTDDGQGSTQVTTYRRTIACTGCRRPVSEADDLQGVCDYCRARGLCTRCMTLCAVCSRRLCIGCRRGFAGDVRATVCPICLARLQRRQAFQDQVAIRRMAIQHQLLRQREWARIQALRLQAARVRANAEYQAARLRQTGRLAALREMSRLRLALARAGRYVVRSFR